MGQVCLAAQAHDGTLLALDSSTADASGLGIELQSADCARLPLNKTSPAYTQPIAR